MAETTEKVVKTKKTVKIKIPLTRNEKDDVYVAINGRSYQIKRGVEVEVPLAVKEVLDHQEEMLSEAMAFESQIGSKD